jgi:hypothetical protein
LPSRPRTGACRALRGAGRGLRVFLYETHETREYVILATPGNATAALGSVAAPMPHTVWVRSRDFFVLDHEATVEINGGHPAIYVLDEFLSDLRSRPVSYVSDVSAAESLCDLLEDELLEYVSRGRPSLSLIGRSHKSAVRLRRLPLRAAAAAATASSMTSRGTDEASTLSETWSVHRPPAATPAFCATSRDHPSHLPGPTVTPANRIDLR